MPEAPDFVTETANDGIPAPYGRACSSCARSKCRCVWQPQSTACERCSRLKKRCEPGVPVRKRTERNRSTAASSTSTTARTTALEQKLNDLVSLLQAKNSIGGGEGDVADHGLIPNSHDAAAAAVLSSLGNSGSSSASPSDHLPGAAIFSSLRPSGSCASPNDSIPTSTSSFVQVTPPIGSAGPSRPRAALETDPVSLIDTKDMEACFHRFRTHMLPYYPFVYIPSGTTAQGFRRHRPFLFLVIMAITYRQSALQTLLSERARDIVAQKVAREQDRSLDHLLGILCFLGWKQYGRKDKVSDDRSVITVFCQLAMGLVYDLCLHKQRTQRVSLLMVFRPLHVQQQELLTEPPPLTNEERRAVLATFLMTSQSSLILKRIDALRWTQQMDEALRVLSVQPECYEDSILVTQVRLQLIVEQANQSEWSLGQVLAGPMPGLQSAELPPGQGLSPILVSSLRSKIADVLADASPEVRNHAAIIMQSATADLFITESTVDRPSSASTLATDLSRLSALERCVQCTRTFFDCLLGLDAYGCVSISFPLICMFTHNLLSLYTLSTRQEQGWDRLAVRDTIDVIAVLDKLIDFMPKMGQVLALVDQPLPDGTSGLNDTFEHSVRVFRQFREMWSAELDGIRARDMGQVQGQGQNTFQGFDGMDFTLNEEWLRDVFG